MGAKWFAILPAFFDIANSLETASPIYTKPRVRELDFIVTKSRSNQISSRVTDHLATDAVG